MLKRFLCLFPLKAVSEQLAARKDQVSEAIRNTQVFLMSKQASKYVSVQRQT